MKALVVAALVCVAAAGVMAAPDDDYFFHRRPYVHVYRPVRPTRYVARHVVRQYAAPFTPFHYFDDDHFDRKRRSADPEPQLDSPHSRQKRDADFDSDDYRWHSFGHARPTFYRPAPTYYRPGPALPYVFSRGFYDDK